MGEASGEGTNTSREFQETSLKMILELGDGGEERDAFGNPEIKVSRVYRCPEPEQIWLINTRARKLLWLGQLTEAKKQQLDVFKGESGI